MIVLVGVYGLMAFTGLVMVVGAGDEISVRVLGVVATVGGIYLGVMAWYAGVDFTRDELVINRSIRVERIPWEEIEGFTVAQGGKGVQPTHTLHVELVGGGRVRIQELSASAIVHPERSFVHGFADQLNEELERRRPTPP